MDGRAELLQQIRNRRPGYSLGQKFYADPGYYRLDLEAIHHREWLFAGHDCEIAEAGDYFTLTIGDYPVIVLRREDGSIGALHNTCRHRGSRLCATPKGRFGRRIVCPYHQWAYHHDGRLAAARQMMAEIDAGRHGLKPVHCESVGGYIFVCVAPVAPDFAPVRAAIAPYLLPHRLDRARVAFESRIVEKGNWKLVWENNRECYHCRGSHPELCRSFPERPTVTNVDGTDEATRAHAARCEAAGLPSAFRLSADGQYRTVRVPLEGEAVSLTMNGRAAVSRPLSDAVTEPAIGSMLLFHYPGTWNHVLGDHAISFRVLPLSPTETEVTTKWLVHRDAVEGRDYDLTTLTEVWLATNDQDRAIVEGNQAGILSPAYEPGPYSQIHEGGVMQFVDWYCATMERNLGATAGLGRVA
ncbi:MAG: aromatic ring-hydroxylating dioxygenase subunit alpha [Thalassobaculales bacterium]